MRIIILILLVTGILIHAWGSRRWAMPSNQQLLQQQLERLHPLDHLQQHALVKSMQHNHVLVKQTNLL